eukprot:NODE_2498_length_469_cov_545.711905_g2060_i0.p1 GENE.NODE_2498_length_469_cov_545.711905_g2060_i0~~NODE_2498_length_469_cov_545.711905_g2060_i0.p1  ORF type:complete len:86 (-),score=28.58 NODE_2498_length_469_cov_545.711905_g2060_i0:211-435(-)
MGTLGEINRLIKEIVESPENILQGMVEKEQQLVTKMRTAVIAVSALLFWGVFMWLAYVAYRIRTVYRVAVLGAA